MDQTKTKQGAVNREQPAVALLLSGGNSDAIAGTILRATREGHDVLAYTDERTTAEAESFARELGAILIDSPQVRENGNNPINYLATRAREIGYPGLVVVDDPCTRIDLAASTEGLQTASEYTVEAIPATAVAETASTIAAIPAYNEAGSIGEVVRTTRQYVDEVMVIDDGSTDETVAVASEAGATVIRHETNRGYGAALKTAFQEADRANVDQLVTIDGDGQHDPADIVRLLNVQHETKNEIVIGSRFVDGSNTELPVYRQVGIGIVNTLTNAALGVVRARNRVSDTQCGFRAYDRTAIASLAADSNMSEGMGASTDILYHAFTNGYRIREVGTTVDYDVEGANSQNPVSHGLHLVNNLLRTVEYEHPVLVLGIPGFIFAFIGITFGYLTVTNYLQTMTLSIGLGGVSAFFFLTGIFAAFTAIILHAMVPLVE